MKWFEKTCNTFFLNTRMYAVSMCKCKRFMAFKNADNVHISGQL